MVIGTSQLGRSYTIDGDAKQIRSQRLFMTSYTDSTDIDSLHLDVYHEGSHEAMRLWLSIRSKPKPWQIGRVSALKEGMQLTALAERASVLLDLPIQRSGTPIYAGGALPRVLDRVQPHAASGDGRDIRINCPACGAKSVAAISFNEEEKLHGITVKTTTWVKCQACGKHLYSKLSPEELSGRSPADLESFVVVRTSLIASSMAILAILLCVVPVLGLCLAVVSTVVNARRRGWARMLSLVALVISLLTSGWMIFVLKGGLHH